MPWRWTWSLKQRIRRHAAVRETAGWGEQPKHLAEEMRKLCEDLAKTKDKL